MGKTSKPVLLFDLDGTLIDSAPGIFDTLEFTLAKFGKTAPRAGFMRHLGPPMRQSLAEYLPETQLEEALEIYRAEYDRTGALCCAPYDGIRQMLEALYKQERVLCVATSKPRAFAQKILDHFDLSQFFAVIGGAEMDASLDTKEAVMRDVMARAGALAADCVMIGDRCYDMEGAHACVMRAIGVLYGYGTREELAPYAPVFIAENVTQLGAFLEQMG